MKFLMIVPEVYFQAKGTPFSSYNRARILEDLGHSVDIVTYPYGEDRKLKGKLFRCPNFPFVTDVKSGPSIAKVLMDIPLSMKIMQLLMQRKYDVVYCHEEAALFGAILGKIFGKKTVYDMHSYIPELFSDWGVSNSKTLREFGDFLMKAMVWLNDIVVVNCPNLKDEVKKFSKKEVIVAENSGVMLIKPKKTRSRFINIVYTGSFVPLQNLELLLNSIPHVIKEEKNARFILVGGKPREVEKYQKHAHLLKIAEYIRIEKRVAPEKIQSYLDMADILVSPRSRGINIPFKIYSLMESGKPIVASDTRLYNTFLDDTNAVMAKPNPKGFAQGILKLAKDKKLRDRLGSAARKKLMKEYNYQKYKEKMKVLCDQLGY